jgi:hypothetical protein
MWRLFLSAVLLFLACVGWADPQDSQYKSSFQKMQDDREKDRQRQQAVSDLHATSRNLGFHETRSGEASKDVVAQAISDAILTPYYEAVLVLRFFCETPSSLIRLFPRYKDLSWKLDRDEAADKGLKFTSEGQAQTDGEGFARIRFSTRGSVSSKSIHLRLGSQEKILVLSRGPYEIPAPEEFCKNKR